MGSTAEGRSVAADVVVRRAASAEDFAVGRRLFEEYQVDIDADLCFQNFAAELEALATMYGEPAGALLLAERDGRDVGCVAVRRLEGSTCEMKRLWVRPEARGIGLGRRLALAIVEQARALGYETMRLDTLPQMATAQVLYRDLGFEATEPYYDNPIPGATYMRLDLRRRS